MPRRPSTATISNRRCACCAPAVWSPSTTHCGTTGWPTLRSAIPKPSPCGSCAAPCAPTTGCCRPCCRSVTAFLPQSSVTGSDSGHYLVVPKLVRPTVDVHDSWLEAVSEPGHEPRLLDDQHVAHMLEPEGFALYGRRSLEV